MNPSLPPFLFVEDTASDYEIAVRGLRRLGVGAPTVCCADLDQAAAFLRHSPGHPGLIVLDLRLPDGDGSEFLRLVRSHPQYHPVPVAVWSASTDPRVIDSCYRQGATTYLPKAADRTLTEQTIREFARMWRPAN